MKIEVKGHSGCQIDVVPEDNDIYVYKSTVDPKYLKRLVLQAEKQKQASEVEYQHIRVPKIYVVERSEKSVVIKMEYVYSKNFIEFFEQAGFEQIEYLVGALKYFIDYEVTKCSITNVPTKIFIDKIEDISEKSMSNTSLNSTLGGAVENIIYSAKEILLKNKEIVIPVGLCHGDLTFSNILFNGNNYYLIDFLDSFVETPLQDIVKIRQDSKHYWSQLMYTKKYDSIRLRIILEKIDKEIDTYFSEKYQWYRDYYNIMQLINLLRILPYAHDKNVILYLEKEIKNVLNGF